MDAPLIVNNSEVITEISDGLKLPVSFGKVSNSSRFIQPTFECNPKVTKNANYIKASSSATSGSTTIHTGVNTGELYILNVNLSICKDATCDIATGQVTVNGTINGVSTSICGIAVLTTTAQNQSISVSFSKPIKIDRNTSISITGTYTAGLMSRYASIIGYFDYTGR